MGKPFERVHACVAGKVDQANKIPEWLRANGGTYSKAVTKGVTHLIATEEAYQKDDEKVQKAKFLGTVRIVSFDWLEDSLVSRSRRPKPEGPYLWKNLLREKAQEDPKQKKPTRDPWSSNKVTKNSGARKGNKGPTQPRAKIFEDSSTGELWEVAIIRASPPPRSREKYLLGIFETIAEPRTYSAFAKYSRVGKSTVELLTPAKADKALAIKAFKEFFEQQTGKKWEERADGKAPPPKTDKDGNGLPAHEGWYALEATGNLFTDWMKAYKAPSDSADNDTATNALSESGPQETLGNVVAYENQH